MKRTGAPATGSLARRLLTAAALALACSACDAPDGAAWVQPSTAAADLRVVASNVSGGALGQHESIRVHFDRALDPATVGLRSVRVEGEGRRRVPHVRARALGNTLIVSAPVGASLPVGVPLTLRLEGGGSPRALAGLDGSRLARPWAIPVEIVRGRRADLVAPVVTGSTPAHGEWHAAPGAHVEVRFDEPVSRSAIRASGAVVLQVDGRERAAALRLSADLRSLVVRPTRPLPAGADVTLLLGSGVHDLAGNPLRATEISFRTRATRLHEIAEDFVTTEMADRTATTGGWAMLDAPGFLVPRAGRVHWSPADGDPWDAALGPLRAVRFQTVLPGWSSPGGIASALRLSVRSGAPEGVLLVSAVVEAGATSLERAEPTFGGNRAAAELVVAGQVDVPVAPARLDDDDVLVFDVPFDVPVALRPGAGLLLDVFVEFSAPVTLAAAPDTSGAALVDGGPRLLPAAELLVSGGAPQARSGWYDSGTQRPEWREAIVVTAGTPGAPAFVVEFQTAAGSADGGADADRASEWSATLGDLPSLRYARFRVRFAGLGLPGRSARIDRIVLPYED